MKSLKASSIIALGSLFLSLILPASTFAADGGQCSIESGPSTELSDYITKLDTVMGKLKDAASKASCGSSGNAIPSSSENIARAAATITRGTNRALSQDCYL